MSANKLRKESNDIEQVQLLTLKHKHHNPPPKKVVSNKPDNLTPDIVWSDPVPKCFLYSCVAVALMIFIIIIHNYIQPHYGHHHGAKTNHAAIIDSAPSNPHIIWFILDDLGQSDFSHHGAEFFTPNIDHLAENGIELLQHYVSPICSATRSALLSGRFAYKMGLQGVLMDYVHPSTISHIPVKFKTIGNYLQMIGYNTRIYGKWHVGYSKESYTPLQRGFNSHIGHYQYAIDPFTKLNLDAWRTGKDWFVDGEFSDNQQYSSDILLEGILDDIDQYEQGDDPLFMYISFTNPHFPVVTPDEFNAEHMGKCGHIANMERRKYCLSVIYLDLAIGEITDKLKENGLYEDTIIALTGDNGPQVMDLCNTPGNHVAAGSAYPYRGGKYTLFQGGVQTPGFLSGGLIEDKYKGTQSQIVLHAVDWMPTLLHFTSFYDDGHELDENHVDGIDLYDEIFNHHHRNKMTMSDKRDYLILSMEYDQERYINTAIIYKRHKLLINNQLTFFGGGTCNVRSAQPDKHNAGFHSEILNDGQQVPDLMLFDIGTDPNEYNDILNGAGSSNEVFNDDENEIKQLIVTMIKILNNERINNVPDMKTQAFETFVAPNFNEPVDTKIIDGVHKPWQSEDEQEFPDGFNY